MKCYKCQMEWTDNEKFSSLKECPFCKSKLNLKGSIIEEQTMGSTLNHIRNKYGDAVFADKAKLYSIFKDLAPQLRKELTALQMVMLLNIDKYFIGVPEEKRNDSIYAFKQKANEYLKSSVIDMTLTAFSEVFGCGAYESVLVSFSDSHEYTEEIINTSQDSNNENYDTDELNFEFVGTKLIYYSGKKQYIAIPEKTEIIGAKAFFNLKIKGVLLPEGLKKIEDSAFKKCSKLSKIIIPKNVTDIGKSAFSDCKSLEKVEWHSDFKSIKESVFEKCIKLKEIIIPDGVVNIGENCFNGCTGLVEVKFSKNSKCEKIGKGAFENCISLEKIFLPEKVKEIGNGCFAWCRKIKSINIPSKLQIIGTDALDYCSLLERIEYDEKNPVVSTLTLLGCDNLIIINNSFKIEGHKLLKYNRDDENVIIPLGINIIGKEVFANQNIKSVIVPGSVNTIEENAFYDCKSLEYLGNLKMLRRIGCNAFYNTNINLLELLKVGDVVKFGYNDSKYIEWIVIEIKSFIRVISRENICRMPFDDSNDEWNDSSLRRWLNTDFYDSSFTSEEKRNIVRTNTDKVRLLTKREYTDLSCGGLDGGYGSEPWWLRTKTEAKSVTIITGRCFAVSNGVYTYDVCQSHGVRPVLTIKPEMLKLAGIYKR